MNLKLKVKVSMDKARLKEIIARKQKLVLDNVVTVLRQEAGPHLIALIMRGYDKLAEVMSTLPEDPTHPAYWREEFLAQIMSDFEDNFIVQDNRILIRMGDKEFLGYTPGERLDPDDAQPVHWLVFYLEGLVGEWAFISPETYQKITRKPYNPSWGRFSRGFMISRREYHAKRWNEQVAFTEVRHPFSGFAPLDIFREALSEFDLRPFVQKAMDATSEGRKL